MMMRVSKDPKDPAYLESSAQRRVWCRDIEVPDWMLADEFRRVVITVTGQVLHGGVRIERLPEDSPKPVEVRKPEVLEPTPEPTSEPTPQLISEPALQLISEPALQLISEPALQLISEPALQSIPDFGVQDPYAHE